MEISLVQLDGARLFVRHTAILQSRPTVLCVHGLGESGLSFREAFRASSLQDVNIIVPDLLGHGCSTDDPDGSYSFRSYIKCLNRLVDAFGLSAFYLVGHSMGGDIATHFAEEAADKVKGLVNIEGNLTPGDVLISAEAVRADERGEFGTWFREDFMTETVMEKWGKIRPSCLRYYASLWFCRPEAFRLSAHEVYRQNRAETGTYASKTGFKFQRLSAPKVYCWGELLTGPTEKLIEDSGILHWGFKDAFHWPMIDEEVEFYHKLAQFCSEN